MSNKNPMCLTGDFGLSLYLKGLELSLKFTKGLLMGETQSDKNCTASSTTDSDTLLIIYYSLFGVNELLPTI